MKKKAVLFLSVFVAAGLLISLAASNAAEQETVQDIVYLTDYDVKTLTLTGIR
jgi:hypothetical protein